MGRRWIGAALLLCSCAEETPREPFQVMVISDVHARGSEHVDTQRLVEHVERLSGPEWNDLDLFVVTGDLVHSLYETYPPADPADSRLAGAVAILDQMEIPVLPVLGNHEYELQVGRDAGSAQEVALVENHWRETTGRERFGYEEIGGFRFVALDSWPRPTDGGLSFDVAQTDWLDGVLAEGVPTVLFAHHPLETDTPQTWSLTPDEVVGRDETRVFEVLSAHRDTVRAIFVGHGHLWVKDTLFGTIPVFETAAMGSVMPNIDNYHLLTCNAETGTVDTENGAHVRYMPPP
jgi:3',5'-cyclic AMP phosphodiesterase CpdA